MAILKLQAVTHNPPVVSEDKKEEPAALQKVEKNTRVRIEGSMAEAMSKRLREMFPKPSAIEIATEASMATTRTTYEAMEDDGGEGQPMNSDIYVYAPAARAIDDKMATEAVARCLQEGVPGRSVIYINCDPVVPAGADKVVKRAESVGVLTLFTDSGLATYLRAKSS